MKTRVVLLSILAGSMLAQEQRASAGTELQEGERASPEAEFVASDVLRSGSLIVPTWTRRRLIPERR
jgi:hypothetical protein